MVGLVGLFDTFAGELAFALPFLLVQEVRSGYVVDEAEELHVGFCELGWVVLLERG